MIVLGPLIVPADVVISPVAELPPALRDRIEYADGDCAVTRPRTRTKSIVVDAQTAALLARFRAPSTIIDAVVALSAADGVDPREMLEAAFAVLGDLVNDGLLVPPDSDLARPIEATLAAGDRVGGFEVRAPAHIVADTAVYRARAAGGAAVALKVARDGAEDAMRAEFAREAAILGSLDGLVTPRLVAAGDDDDGRPYIAMSWCSGVDVYEAAAELRGLGGRVGREALISLVEGLIDAYAQLHAQDVLHGDVHPRNVVVRADGGVTIIDFGLAARPLPPGSAAADGRGGIDLFLEPEVAAARLAGRPLPAVCAAGEQYSLAALAYLVLTGAHTHAFALEQDAMLRQLVEEPPLAFERQAVDGLPAVERVIGRALAKAPGDRYASVAALGCAFRDAAAQDARAAAGPAPAPAPGPARRDGPGPARRLLDEVLTRLAIPGGQLHAATPVAPTASVDGGAAGVAYALLRVAGIRGDPVLLGQADLWSQRALIAAATPAGFRSDELPEPLGLQSLYHGAPGVYFVAALVALARGDETLRDLAIADFVRAVGSPGDALDIGFGRAGLLVGCALLLEGAATSTAPDDLGLRRLGCTLHDGLIGELDARPELAACEDLRLLGAAHGWAGVLFALLRWSQATGSSPGRSVVDRLDQLAALGWSAGRGTVWPRSVGESPLENPLGGGWCNGAAGYVSLWTLAHRLTRDDAFAGLAQTAAWTAYEDSAEIGNLCCGLAGRAYALLNVYRNGGGDPWLARARKLADRAALHIERGSYRPDSLYSGEPGAALLAADLEDPANACMPLYEGERWANPGRPGCR